MRFLSVGFPKIYFFKSFYQDTIKMSNSLDSDPAWQNVMPDLGPTLLQRLSADDTGG